MSGSRRRWEPRRGSISKPRVAKRTLGHGTFNGTETLKGFHSLHLSIPNVSRIVINTVFFQYSQQLVLKRFAPVVLRLIRDVSLQRFDACRPDGEGADQPTFAEVEEAARKHGLSAAHLPVVSGKVTDSDASAFGDLLDRLPAPTVAYCRTGTRSASSAG